MIFLDVEPVQLIDISSSDDSFELGENLLEPVKKKAKLSIIDIEEAATNTLEDFKLQLRKVVIDGERKKESARLTTELKIVQAEIAATKLKIVQVEIED